VNSAVLLFLIACWLTSAYMAFMVMRSYMRDGAEGDYLGWSFAIGYGCYLGLVAWDILRFVHYGRTWSWPWTVALCALVGASAIGIGGRFRLRRFHDERRALSRPAGNALKVLIADDHVMVVQMFKILFAARGYEVLPVALTTAEALAAARAHRPDIAVIDVYMNGGTIGGLALISELRRQFPGLVIVAISGDAFAVNGALAAGADEFVAKAGTPTSTQDVFTAVEAQVAKRRAGKVSQPATKGDKK